MAEISSHGRKVLEERYLKRDEKGFVIESTEEMFERVAWAVADAEPENKLVWEGRFYNMMNSLDFLPNSPCLANAGKNNLSLSACYVLPVGDSLKEIFESVKNAALIHQSGGGTGFSFTHLRPAGSNVSTTGHSASGPVSFMSVFDSATNAIKQGGMRRGANMGMLRVDHPDILDFIHCKDGGRSITNFNISVLITDDFLQRLEKGLEYDLVDPHTGRTTGSLSAAMVWNEICTSAWKTGDPGVVFIDRVNASRANPIDGWRVGATNPCVTGDTLLLTKNGWREIQSLVSQHHDVWNGHEFTKVLVTETGQNLPIVTVRFSDGSDLTCTLYHRFILKNGMEIKARDLTVGDRLARFSFPVVEGEGIVLPKAYTHGVYSGDGSYEISRNRHSIWLYGKKKELTEHIDCKSIVECAGDRLFCTLDNETVWSKTFVPDTKYMVLSRLEWLAGLIDTDGGHCGNGAVAIWSIEKEFLQDVKRMLHTLGVSASLSLGKPAQVKPMPDGNGGMKEYQTQDCYRLLISGSEIASLVALGLKTHRLDMSYIPSRAASRFITVTDIINTGEIADRVFCFTDPIRGMGMFGCVATGQCGEQPLYDYDSCNLGSINLNNFIFESGILESKIVDWTRLEAVVQTAVRFLDNVITINNYPLPEIGKVTNDLRRIGLGVMGWHDMLIQLGIPYDCDEAVALGQKVSKFIQEVADGESLRVGEEKGPFPLVEQSIYRGTSMRNAARTTIAPTGTISLIAGCSSGIEPIFALEFLHQGLEGKLKDETMVSKWAGQDVKTALEIDPIWHLKHQAAWQSGVDNAVSKTINLPHSATIGDVADIYITAALMGCMGVTVFRDGCRDSQVLVKGDGHGDREVEEGRSGEDQSDTPHLRGSSTEFSGYLQIGAADVVRRATTTTVSSTDRAFILANEGGGRGRVLVSRTYRQPTAHGNMYVTVTECEGEPYEVFATIGKAGSDVQSMAEALGRVASKYLQAVGPGERRGVVGEIARQLSGIGSSLVYGLGANKVVSIPDAISKVLQEEVGRDDDRVVDRRIASSLDRGSGLEDRRQVTYSALNYCPDCGQSLYREEGCEKCYNCGFSRC